MDNQEKVLLAASIRNRLFASRDTVDDALNYAVSAIDRLVTSDDRAAMYTALHVVMNTVADKIDALPDSSAANQIAHADLPATGEPLLSDRISDIVDQRIKFQLKGFDQSIDRRIEKAINDYDYEDIITNMVRNMSFTIDVE